MTEIIRSDCEALDRDDPLASFRDEFILPDGVVYLDGNSLGARPKAALARAHQLLDQEWGIDLIRSWNSAGWWDLPTSLGDKLAHLIGAGEGEVVVTDSTGINIFKVMSSALTLRPDRRVIVMEGSNFPTNNYTVQGLVEQLGGGYDIRFVEEAGLEAAITEDVAVVFLTQVHYKSGRKLDMAALTAKTQDVGAISIWDLCHSAGAFEVELNNCNVDFAVGCTYKYLNGGPGSPAFVFVAKRHQGVSSQPLTGWWGHEAPFAFERDYRPATDIRQMKTGTQPMLSLAVAEVGIDLMIGANMCEVRRKSLAMTELFIALFDQRCTGYDMDLVTPRDGSKRGSQVSLLHKDGYAIVQAMIARGVIGDFRAPDNMRFGFTPLYLSYSDVWDAVEHLVQIMESGEWQHEDYCRVEAVT